MSKKLKTENQKVQQILSPFRTVGLVANDIECSVGTLGETYTLATSVGNQVQIYDAASLKLLFLTQPTLKSKVTALNMYHHYLFVATNEFIYVYKRGKQISEFKADTKIFQLLAFGNFCLAVSKTKMLVFKFELETLSLYTSIKTMSVLGPIVGCVHPPTYLNKVVLATQSCPLLVNIKTGKILHTYDDMNGIDKVEALPNVLDLIAVSAHKTVTFLNLKTGKPVLEIETGVQICSMAFRSDGVPLMALGTLCGDVLVYDLNMKRRVQTLHNQSSVDFKPCIKFLGVQPVMVVSGGNELKEFVFDPPVTANGACRARLLRYRGGHSSQPSCLLFDDESHFVYSGSLDGSLYLFSLRKDSQSRKLGNSTIDKYDKLMRSSVISMAYSPRKTWATLVVAYSGSKTAFTWNAIKGCFGDVQLHSTDSSIIKSVAVSNCGNFGLIGTSSGKVIVYNLQSGLRRQDIKPHDSALTGLAITPNNEHILTCSLDGSVVISELQTGKRICKVELQMGAVTCMRYHAASKLLACATDDMSLAIIDTHTTRVVRSLSGHGNRITSLDFSPSGRLLLSSSLDSTLRIWDIPTGACISGIRLEIPATEIRVSGDGEYVATAHVQGLGVRVWTINSLFGNIRAVREEEFPSEFLRVNEEEGIEIENVEFETDSMQSLLPTTLNQIDNNITLSKEPSIKFTTLVHLDAIRVRNKPIESVKTPKKVPFFLGLNDDAESTESKAINHTRGPMESFNGMFSKILASKDHNSIVSYLASLGPAATDLEIRSLDANMPQFELVAFVNAMTTQLNSGGMFELVQAWMKIFLEAHRDLFAENLSVEMQQSLENFKLSLVNSTNRLNDSIRYCAGVLGFLK